MIEALNDRDELLTRYLLNELSEGENEDLEDEMVLDGVLAERRQTVEMNLIDSYVMGEMSAEDRLRFESGFLIFPENRRKVEEARMLHESLRLLRKEQAAEGREEPGGATEPSRGGPERADRSRRGWFAFFPKPAFAVAALLLALGLGYFFVPWRDIFNGVAGNRGGVANVGPQATPVGVADHGGTPNSNGHGNLNDAQNPPPASGQSTPVLPEVALNAPPPEVVSGVIFERPGLVGGAQTKGSGAGRTQAQPVAVPSGSKLLRLTLNLRQDRAVESAGRLSVKVYKIDDLENVVYPVEGSLKLTPRRAGGRQPRYFVNIEIPASRLRNGQAYYVRVNEEPVPAAAFKVMMTDAGR